ncbi:hypothetical protein N9N03_02770 [Chlamydiia bacterium]|nr:hypothetical protein [Chlamydiia bacterium]
MPESTIEYLNTTWVANEISLSRGASVQSGTIESENRPFLHCPVFQIKIGNKSVYSYEMPYYRIYVFSIVCFTTMVYLSHFTNMNTTIGYLFVLSVPTLFYLEHNNYFSTVMKRKCALLRNVTYFSLPSKIDFIAFNSNKTEVSVAEAEQPFNALIVTIKKLGGLNIFHPNYPIVRSLECVYVNRSEIFRNSKLGLLINNVIFGLSNEIKSSHLHTKIKEKYWSWKREISQNINFQIDSYLSEHSFKPNQLTKNRCNAGFDVTSSIIIRLNGTESSDLLIKTMSQWYKTILKSYYSTPKTD